MNFARDLGNICTKPKSNLEESQNKTMNYF